MMTAGYAALERGALLGYERTNVRELRESREERDQKGQSEAQGRLLARVPGARRSEEGGA
jgi:hypothetical protein